MNEPFPQPVGLPGPGFRRRKESPVERHLLALFPSGVPKVKFLSRFVQIESSPATVEYGLIAGAMGLALLAIAPIVASSLASAWGG